MQVLIVYHSSSGNTRKLAEGVANGVKSVQGVTAVLKSTGDVSAQDFRKSAGVVAGSPTYYGTMSAELKRVLEGTVSMRSQMEGKVGAAFTSSGDPTGGKETTMMSIHQFFLISGMIVVGDPMDATGHYGTACAGAPDAECLENAAKLGKRVAELCLKLGN